MNKRCAQKVEKRGKRKTKSLPPFPTFLAVSQLQYRALQKKLNFESNFEEELRNIL
jgi:hypothetical protein